jgi:hypothetical protein
MIQSRATQTFLSLQKKAKTLEEYKFPKPDPLKKFKEQTQNLAYCLMFLWTPKVASDKHNYLAVIKNTQLHFQGHLNPPEEIDADLIHSKTSQNQALHLGFLSFFDLLFCADLSRSPIWILKNPDENQYIFSQKPHPMWQDYFYPQHNHMHFFSKHSETDKLNCHIKKNHPWWNTAFANVNIRQLFMNEFFEAIIRIYTTPWSLIEKIVYHTIGHQFFLERKKFLLFLENKLERFIDEFENFLSTQEQLQWIHFIKTQGLQKFVDFDQAVNEFFQHYPIVNPYEQKQVKDFMLAYALNLHIPNLESYLSREQILNYEDKTQAFAYEYIRENVNAQWYLMCKNPHHPLWVCLEEFGAGMKHYHDEIDISCNPENLYLLAKGIQYHFYYFVRFFIIQNSSLKNGINTLSSIEDMNDHQIKNRSMLFISLISVNKEACLLLRNLMASIQDNEIYALQQVLLECTECDNRELFKFIIRYYPDILDEAAENHMPFRTYLENHCNGFAPAFLEFIPRVTMPVNRFFSKTDSNRTEEVSESSYGLLTGSKI